MNSAIHTSCAEAVEGLLSLVNAQEPILDTTYGSGDFWKGSSRSVVGCDICPTRARDRIEDFTSLSFADKEFPTVVYDPPFHPYVGSVEEKKFRGMGKNDRELRQQFDAGLRECWRVTSRHLIVKCQGFIHNHRPQWMPLWAVAVCGEPFEWLVVYRNHKVISGRWKNTFSLRRNHADYLLFDKKGNIR